jgi:uncharacterized membrane protein
MKKTLLIIACLFSILFSTAQSAKKIYNDIQNKKIKVLFHGSGTEPFWDLYILENSAIYAAELVDIYENLKIENSFDKYKYSQIINLKNSNGDKTSVKIIKKSCSDGMSPKKYSHTVIYADQNGCGQIGY